MNKKLIKLYKFLKGAGLVLESEKIDSWIKFAGEEKDRENFRFYRNSADFINYNDVDYNLVKESYFKIIDYVVEMAEGFSAGDLSGGVSDGVGKFFRDFARNFLDSVRSDRNYFSENFPGLESSWDSAALFRILVIHSLKASDYCGELFDGSDSILKRLECLKDVRSFVSDSDNIKAEDFVGFIKNYKHKAKSSRLEDKYSAGDLSEYEFKKEKLGYDFDTGKISVSEYSKSLKDLRKDHDIPEPVLDDESSEEEF